MAERFAIYYAPAPTDALWERASFWLGRDPSDGDRFDGPVAGVERNRLLNLTQSASRYGFHATLKAPMTLVRGATQDDLTHALQAFAASMAPVEIGRLVLTDIDGFLALTPTGSSDPIRDFAATVVETFDDFRAPMSLKDREARMSKGLTPRQEELLDAYGYPYVFEEFFFHMTLTDRLSEADRDELQSAARTWFSPVLDTPVRIDRLSLYVESENGRPLPAGGGLHAAGTTTVSRDLDFFNARIVLADTLIEGSLSVRDGMIADVKPGGTAGVDLEGDYLIAGLVELHTDHLENHYRPRPGVFWDPMAALQAHDGQIAASGITTVFDAVRIGSDLDMPEMGIHVEKLVNAIRAGRDQDRLRVDHFIHLRCELPSHDVLEHFEAYADHPLTRLASVMDHTPGQRQFQSLDDYRRFYKDKMGRSEAETERYLADRLAEHERYSAVHRTTITRRAAELGLALASHDDATAAHVEEAVRDGVRISEFPTSRTAAEAAHAAGLSILMGAPNVVRGKSHSGNVAATELAEAGLLDILSSDYVPFALLQAAFLLPDRVSSIDLPAALRTVTLNPARVARLDDRGEIAPGKRADLVHVEVINAMPVVRGVWREGKRVS